MDIPRKSVARSRRIRRIILGVIVAIIVILITVGVSRLKPAAQTVDRATVWIGNVERGSMIRQVRGLGTLVPVEIRWIPAVTEGRVERIVVFPGTPVKADTVILELSNPELEQAVVDAEAQLKGAEAAYTDLKVRLQSQLLDQQAQAAKVQADYSQAKLQAEVNAELVKQGLVADVTYRLSKLAAEELANRNKLEQKRLDISSESIQAQLAIQQSRVDQLRTLYNLKRSQLEALQVRPGIAGMLQVVPVEVGQRVAPGTNLARVADPTRLKAEIKIAETQAKDVQLGQPTAVDTRNGIIPGHVIRIDPSVQNGTVTVDAALDGPLPKGARPDLSIEGTVELERLENILYVGRPVHGQEQSTVGLFKLENGSNEAVRVQVKLGRGSVNTIEVLQGLNVGDQVILSDTSAWDNSDRIRLK